MPKPRRRETQDHFISRCMRYPDLRDKPREERLGMCYGLWREHRGGKCQDCGREVKCMQGPNAGKPGPCPGQKKPGTAPKGPKSATAHAARQAKIKKAKDDLRSARDSYRVGERRLDRAHTRVKRLQVDLDRAERALKRAKAAKSQPAALAKAQAAYDAVKKDQTLAYDEREKLRKAQDKARKDFAKKAAAVDEAQAAPVPEAKPTKPAATKPAATKPAKKPAKKPENASPPLPAPDVVRAPIPVPENATRLADQVHKALSQESKHAIADYTSDMYQPLNESLRDAKPLTPGLAKTYGGLKAAFAAVPELAEPETVYRAMTLPHAVATSLGQEMLRAAETGGTVEFKGFMSTSLNPAVPAGNFAHDPSAGARPLMLEIVARRGLYLEELTSSPEEQEMLLDESQRFRVVGIREIDYDWQHGVKKILTYQLEQL